MRGLDKFTSLPVGSQHKSKCYGHEIQQLKKHTTAKDTFMYTCTQNIVNIVLMINAPLMNDKFNSGGQTSIA